MVRTSFAVRDIAEMLVRRQAGRPLRQIAGGLASMEEGQLRWLLVRPGARAAHGLSPDGDRPASGDAPVPVGGLARDGAADAGSLGPGDGRGALRAGAVDGSPQRRGGRGGSLPATATWCWTNQGGLRPSGTAPRCQRLPLACRTRTRCCPPHLWQFACPPRQPSA